MTRPAALSFSAALVACLIATVHASVPYDVTLINPAQLGMGEPGRL